MTAGAGPQAWSQPGDRGPLSAAEVPLEASPLAEGDVVSGSPTAGSRTVRTFDDVEVGIWEMTPGVARDVEEDEVFVVLAGAATVGFEDGREVTLRPGDLMSLVKGERTEWTVTETLRKVYVLRSGDAVASA
jgi:uncharacterized cupin superfamily protein